MKMLLLLLAVAAGADDESYLAELDFQREAVVKELLKGSKADKKKARAIKQGGDFVPRLFLDDDGRDRAQRRPFGEVNADKATVVGVEGPNTIFVELYFQRTLPAGTLSQRATGGTPARNFEVRVEGVDTKGLVEGDAWKPTGVFQLSDDDGQIVLKPFSPPKAKKPSKKR